MTEFSFTHVRRFKRGATDSDGNSRLCTRCSMEARHSDYERRRRSQATVTALLCNGSRFKMPVAYCDEHVPKELETT